MYHFIALVWQPRLLREEQVLSRILARLINLDAQWNRLLHVEGLAVYVKGTSCGPMRTYILPQQSGVILGRLFSSGPELSEPNAPRLDSEEILKSHGNALRDCAWGGYVAMLRSVTEDTVVIRDCSGRIPCYCARVGDLYLFFCDIRDLDVLHLDFTINDRYVASFIAHQPLHVRETGLNEVTELLAGDRLVISSTHQDHDSLWDARLIAAGPRIRSYEEGRARLATCVDQCISAWASISDRILLSLSGGLDSAIVLGSLRKLGLVDRVLCVTRYTDGTADDERAYARAAALMSGVPLIELPRSTDGKAFAENLSRIPPHPRPDASKVVRIMEIDSINCVAAESKCSVVWTGQGGDHVFLQAHHGHGATDYLMDHAIPTHLLTRVYDSALLSRNSVWSIFFRAIRFNLGTAPAPAVTPAGSGHRFLAPTAPPEYPQACPWMAGSFRLPPGKQEQVEHLADLLNRYEPLLSLEKPEQHHPLISQPLMELSLQIPTYHLLRGGRQRSMARDAFCDRVPRCILEREDKGDIKDYTRALFRGSAPYIRESLLDGVLVSRGILDRLALERILVQGEMYRTGELFPLFACIAAEYWARHWVGSAMPATVTRTEAPPDSLTCHARSSAI